jgi:DNA-binding CsgD family transcriptional regulator
VDGIVTGFEWRPGGGRPLRYLGLNLRPAGYKLGGRSFRIVQFRLIMQPALRYYPDNMSVEKLSPREKECLRLMLQAMRPKDIARATGLSLHTVNGHLKSARRKLGTNDSLTAARIFGAHESPQKIGGASVSGSPPPPQPVEGDCTETTTEAGIRSPRSTYPFSTRERPRNSLSVRWRLLWPILLLGFVALGAGMLVSGAASLSMLFLDLHR